MIKIKINTIDISAHVRFGSVQKTDNINQRVDTLKFTVFSYDDDGIKPEVGDIVALEDDSTTTYGGVIVKVSESMDNSKQIEYEVECKDNSYFLDRFLVVERYENTTVDAIIADIKTRYLDSSFDISNVNCPISVKTITFNRISVTAALEKLSKLTNFQWYIDHDKKIFFFEKNTQTAPFELFDADGPEEGNHIFDSLVVSSDISQLRNRVYIRGGESQGAVRIETQNGDGVKKHFVLANKFSTLPIVRVGGTPLVVGVDYITLETSADCFWNFQEKYVRFKVAPTTGTNNIEFEGTPLFPVQVQFQDPTSIAKYGVHEFAKKDLTIKSKEEAFAFAKAELEAYADDVVEGSFETYKTGLRSGQIITVKSTFRGIDEKLLIQKVQMMMISPGTTPRLKYTVQVATLRTMSIIGVLIDLLKSEDRLVNDTADETLEKAVFYNEDISFSDECTISAAEQMPLETVTVSDDFTAQDLDYPVKFVFGPITPTPGDPRRVFCLDSTKLK